MNLEVRLEGLITTAELASRPDFRLGCALVSPSARTVSGPGGKVIVEPRVMQVLVVLADAAGTVVTRATLFQRCWGSPLVTDDSLNRAVRSLRRIAAEVGENSFEVETIPRTGYRLAVDDAESAAMAPANVSRRSLILGGLAASAAGLGALGYYRFSGSTEDPRVAALIERSDLALANGAMGSERVAVGLLEQAARMDPSNARVLGRLALAFYVGAEHAPPGQVAGLTGATQDAARRALAIDPRQSDALAALALLPPYFGDWLAADRRMNSVLEVDPGHLTVRDVQLFMHAGIGLPRTSSRERLVVSQRAPLHVGHQFKMIYANWILGDVAAADRAADRALQLWPKHPAVWHARLWVLAFTGRAERALAFVEDAEGRPPLPPENVAMLRQSMSALASRRPADVSRVVETIYAMAPKGPSNSVSGVMILAGLGQIDAAFNLANAYLLERGPLMANVRWRPNQVSLDNQRRRKLNMLFVPVSEPIVQDPRFMPMVRDIGLVRYWEQAGIEPEFLARA